jgi:hypothetical protein
MKFYLFKVGIKANRALYYMIFFEKKAKYTDSF